MYSVRTPCEAMSLTAAAGSSQARESYMSTHVPRPRYAVMEAEPAAADACGRAAPTRPMRTVSPAMRSRRPGLLSEYGRVWDERSVTRIPPGGCRVRPPVYAGPAGGPARPLPPSPAAPAALRRPTFVVGCRRHDREGGPVSVEYLKQQLGANEKILYTERHHWIFFVAEMVKWIIFAAAVLALIILLKVWLIPDAGWVWWLLLVFLVPAVRIAWGFLSWRMNIYVLSKRVADSSLEKLTDVVLKQSIIGRMLDYGDIVVLTAAAGAGINNLRQIRKPMQFKTAMVNAKEELEHEMGQSR